MDGSDLLDLFSGDDAAARNQAAQLAAAIRRRRAAGTLGVISGDPAMSQLGQDFMGTANRQEQELVGAAQHRAAQQLQSQHYATEEARQRAQEEYWKQLAGAKATEAATHQSLADTKAQDTALKRSERAITRDMWGNPVVVQKYGGGALPGATAAAGGAPPARPAAPAPGRAPATGGSPPPSLPPGMTQEAFDQAAEKAYRTGKFENYGRANAAMKAALQTRIAQLHPDADLASVAGSYAADTSSLKQQQRLLDLTKSWEATGKANLGVLRDVSHQLVNTGSPLANRPLRWLFENVAGDPNVTKFRAAHNAVVNEYAKILSGSMGSAGVTEGARHEAEAMLPLTSTPEQIAAAAEVLETDAGNRLSALAQGVTATQQRMGAHAPAAAAAPAGDGRAALRKKYGL